MTSEKCLIESGAKLKLYNIIEDAVDGGVAYGLMRAYKHTDEPQKEAITDEIVRAVMGRLCEIIDFE